MGAIQRAMEATTTSKYFLGSKDLCDKVAWTQTSNGIDILIEKRVESADTTEDEEDEQPDVEALLTFIANINANDNWLICCSEWNGDNVSREILINTDRSSPCAPYIQSGPFHKVKARAYLSAGTRNQRLQKVWPDLCANLSRLQSMRKQGTRTNPKTTALADDKRIRIRHQIFVVSL